MTVGVCIGLANCGGTQQHDRSSESQSTQLEVVCCTEYLVIVSNNYRVTPETLVPATFKSAHCPMHPLMGMHDGTLKHPFPKPSGYA